MKKLIATLTGVFVFSVFGLFAPTSQLLAQTPPCIVPDNGSGTVTLPPAGCGYLSPQDVHEIANGLPAGTTIELTGIHQDFICNRGSGGLPPGVCTFIPSPACEQPGGSLGGSQECSDSTLSLQMQGTGMLAGYNRTMALPVAFETHVGPRQPFQPVQSFPTDMFRLQGQIPAGDPDFDLLRITAGTGFGMPSPGHTTLTKIPGGPNWSVDSFFDIFYEIEFIGAPGGPLAGLSGSTTGTIRMATGGGACTPANCDDGNACTLDECDAGTCNHIAVNCDDGLICTDDLCNPTNGQCSHVPANCDDGDPCTTDSCVQALVSPQCLVPDNGGGTVTLPPAGCDYLSPSDVHEIIDGLPAGTTIKLGAIHKDFICGSPAGQSVCSFPTIPGVDCDDAGGSLGGEKECSDSTLSLVLNGTGTLNGWNRTVQVPIGFETHVGPRTPGAPVQSFPTDMFRMFGQITNPGSGDPDFDLLRIVAGTDFGLPSPGHTTLTRQQPGGPWAVDSFFDITYRIDFVGKPGGQVSGMSGSTTGTIRMQTGSGVGCIHTPVACDDGNPCTDDVCDPVLGCVFTNDDTNTCSDGNACTQDVCSGGVCTCPVITGACSGTSKHFDSTDVPKVILATAANTVSSTLTVSGAGPYLYDLNLKTGITHTSNSQLQFTLRSPAGTIVTISSNNGGTTDNNFNGTAWDDDADPGNPAPYATPLAASNLVTDALYVNLVTKLTLVPEEALGAFIGEDPNGTWLLTITDQTTGDGGNLASWSLDVVTLAAPPTSTTVSYPSSDVPKAITTVGAPTVTSTVTVGAAGTQIGRVRLSTSITHTFAGDLDITLTSPGGTHVTLTTDNGSSNDNSYNGTLWDDKVDPGNQVPYTVPLAASLLVTDTVYTNLVVETRLVPEEALAALIGENPNGLWTLTISDDANGDGGTLSAWSLEVTTTTCSTTVCAVDCNDNNPCTDDSCDPAFGCVHETNTAACSDGLACTTGDICSGGVCVGAPIDCDDANVCTDDSCNSANGLCVHANNTNECDDGDACTTGDVCGVSTASYFGQNFDGVTAPALPAGWVSTQSPVAATPWTTTTAFAVSLPNSATTDTPITVSDKTLDSPAFIASAGSVLDFDHRYNLEFSGATAFDAAALEIKIGGGAFTDIVTAGGSFISGGYTHTVSAMFSNPLAGRPAWSGASAGFVHVKVNLPAAAAGQSVILRWRVGSDTSAAAAVPNGQWVDNVVLTSTTASCQPGAPANCDDGNACTDDSCVQGLLAPPCIVTDNGGGTVTLPPAGCDYLSPQDVHEILNGLPAGTTIQFAPIHTNFICGPQAGTPTNCSFIPPPGTCDQAGGSLGGNEECNNSTLSLALSGTGTLSGWNRTIPMQVEFETHLAPRTPGAPVQSFDTDMFMMQGQITGDPDFDLLRITGGTAFNMPSPGHTTLRTQGNGTWAVDSYFDITYRIDFVGAAGGQVGGMSGSTTATIRMQTGSGLGCVHTPTDCDDDNPCTIDSCDPAKGCIHTPVSCDDGQICTVDACDTKTGECIHTPANCDDGNACTADTCIQAFVLSPPCTVPDNGGGTVTLPPAGCEYLSPQDVHEIIDGLPAGTTIELGTIHKDFICSTQQPGNPICSFPPPIPGVDCDDSGGSLGGERECAESKLDMILNGTGLLDGFDRVISLPIGFETHVGPRTPGAPVQSFDTDMFRLFGQITNPGSGDPDFDLLRIVAGTDFGMPSPGHTTLTQLGGGNWAVDSFFDITYRIDFVGRPGGALSGMSGSTTGTIRMQTGSGVGCVHSLITCDDGNPCTTDTCDPVSGCVYTPITCDDDNLCTVDSCNPTNGLCSNTPVNCDDGQICTQDACDPATGLCTHTPVNCDDGNACTADSCIQALLLAPPCIVPDNGGGTVTLPPAGCDYLSPQDVHEIVNGLPVGTTIELGAIHKNFICHQPPRQDGVCTFVPPPGFCEQPGGTLSGYEECSDSELAVTLNGTGTLTGMNRTMQIPVTFETHVGPRTPGAPFQSFPTDMFRLKGELPPGDPDFDLLRITAGTGFGMPSPGHTTLTQQPGGNWAVDSFFDIEYQIDFIGAPGGPLSGMSGSTTGTIRMQTGAGVGCVHNPIVCNDNNPCTNDSCDPASGCVFINNTAACDDGNPCTAGDICGGGACTGSPITAPPETQNVLAAPNKTTYSWTAAAFATSYDVVRGNEGALPVGPGGGDEVCFNDLPGATVVDPAIPAVGTAFYYLSRGENTCGSGTWGRQGVNGVPGVLRTTTTCP